LRVPLDGWVRHFNNEERVVMKIELTKNEMFDAVAAGVDRAIWRMITSATDMPGADFWDTLKGAMERSFVKIAEDEIERRRDA